MKTIVTISDLQVPYQHKRAVSALAKFIEDWQPDTVQCVGDEIDLPQVSRWKKGLRGEYAGQLTQDRDETARTLERLKVRDVMRSNHGADRLESYVAQYAPALADMDELRYENFMRFDQLGIRYHRRMWEFAPGWLLAHGDEGGLSSIAGTTAAKLARNVGKSITCGHTHRAGIQPFTEAHSGRVERHRVRPRGRLPDGHGQGRLLEVRRRQLELVVRHPLRRRKEGLPPCGLHAP
jgi:hypothetical protein